MSSIPTHELRREVRHPAWTPVNYDGSAPQLGGSGTNGPNSWQPFGVGQNDYRDGDVTNFRLFKADAGAKVIVSGYSTGETIEDDTGDGDSSVQMRDRSFRIPGGRQITFIVPRSWVWMARFLNVAKNDRAPKRPFELRETKTEIAAIASGQIAINNGSGYPAGHTGAMAVDGAGVGDLGAGDMVTIGSGATVYTVENKTSTTITLSTPLAAAVMDNDAVVRAARTVQTVESLLVNGYQESKEPKQVLMIEADCVAYGEATETGMS